jgi:hypothetical protein
MGFSSTVDRAARILSPFIGSWLMTWYGPQGIAYYAILVMIYVLGLLQWQSYQQVTSYSLDPSSTPSYNNNSQTESSLKKLKSA